jgi:hypothetical protein
VRRKMAALRASGLTTLVTAAMMSFSFLPTTGKRDSADRRERKKKREKERKKERDRKKKYRLRISPSLAHVVLFTAASSGLYDALKSGNDSSSSRMQQLSAAASKMVRRP